jgi:hypothetical protein
MALLWVSFGRFAAKIVQQRHSYSRQAYSWLREQSENEHQYWSAGR